MKHSILLSFAFPSSLVSAEAKGDTAVYYPLFVVALFTLLVFLVYINHKQAKHQEEKYLQQLEAKYRSALQGTDKVRAFELGYFYYRTLRKEGNPTTNDQRTLINDLSAMNTLGSVNALSN